MECNFKEVFVLVGGYGARLAPLTYIYPKPLLMVQGKPFLEILLDSLKPRFKRFILCSGYKSRMFDDFCCYYTFKNPEIEVINSIETVKLGTSGALKNAEEHISTEYFIVINGDTLFDTDCLDYVLNNINYGFLINEVVSDRGVPVGLRILSKGIFQFFSRFYSSLEEDLCVVVPKNIIQIDSPFVDIGTAKDYQKLVIGEL
jgi:choline kinase